MGPGGAGGGRPRPARWGGGGGEPPGPAGWRVWCWLGEGSVDVGVAAGVGHVVLVAAEVDVAGVDGDATVAAVGQEAAVVERGVAAGVGDVGLRAAEVDVAGVDGDAAVAAVDQGGVGGGERHG